MNEVSNGEAGAEELLGRLAALVEELEDYPDAEVREKALDLVQTTLHLYGEALRRMLKTLDSVEDREQIYARMFADDVVRAVLLVHGLLPTPLEHRVAHTIEGLRPFLLAQGCEVKLLGVENGRARLRLVRSGRGAPPIGALKLEIEKAFDAGAPDLLGIEVEGVDEPVEAPPPLVHIKRRSLQTAEVNGKWVSVIRAIGFDEGQVKTIKHADINLLVCKFSGEFYAYRNVCPAQPESALDDALIDGLLLTCRCHGFSYDLKRDGVCVERPELRLHSLPSKIEDDKVKVALS